MIEAYIDTITTGDAFELAKGIPDESVDLVFCDPPYLKRHVEAGIYSRLAEVATRVLKPGGFCLAYTGTHWLPQVMAQMQEYLDFFWLCILRHNGGAGYFHGKHAVIRYTPIERARHATGGVS
jgi:DNA modification methylase